MQEIKKEISAWTAKQDTGYTYRIPNRTAELLALVKTHAWCFHIHVNSTEVIMVQTNTAVETHEIQYNRVQKRRGKWDTVHLRPFWKRTANGAGVPVISSAGHLVPYSFPSRRARRPARQTPRSLCLSILCWWRNAPGTFWAAPEGQTKACPSSPLVTSRLLLGTFGPCWDATRCQTVQGAARNQTG